MLVELASTPVAAGLFFLYIKDKYEKEPWKMLFLGVLFGLIQRRWCTPSAAF